MARSQFNPGQTVASLRSSFPVYTDEALSEPATDLLDETGNAITVVTPGFGFQGPDGVTTLYGQMSTNDSAAVARFDATGSTATSPVEIFGTPGDGKVPTWNAANNRLEWATPSGGGSVPSPTTGDAGKVVTVNEAEDGYELDIPASGAGAPLAALVTIGDELGPTYFGQQSVPLVSPTTLPFPSGVITSPVLTGSAGIVVDGVIVFAPTLGDGAILTCGLRLLVTNLDGTESLRLWLGTNSHALSSDESFAVGETDWHVLAQVGSDLSVDSNGNVASAAGGSYQAALTTTFSYTPA